MLRKETRAKREREKRNSFLLSTRKEMPLKPLIIRRRILAEKV
jgi:hypothetical protein